MSKTDIPGQRQPFRPFGVIAATVTPFRSDESLDLDRLATHLDYLIEAGIHGIVPLGGSGEYVSLTMDERKQVIDMAVRVVNRRVPVTVGALSPSTREVLEIGEYAAKAGADALLVLPPYYIRPSNAGVVDHFQRVTSEIRLPVIAYNNPPRVGWGIPGDLYPELACMPGLIAVKDCDRDVAAIELKIRDVGDRIAILCGDDDLEFASLLSGAHGGIWSAANLTPRLCLKLYEACARGDLEEARQAQRIMLELVTVRKIPNHPGPLKEMMQMLGRSVGPARKPLLPMNTQERERCLAAVSRYPEIG